MKSYFYKLFQNRYKANCKSDYCSDCFNFKLRKRNADSMEEVHQITQEEE